MLPDPGKWLQWRGGQRSGPGVRVHAVPLCINLQLGLKLGRGTLPPLPPTSSPELILRLTELYFILFLASSMAGPRERGHVASATIMD